MTDITSIYVMGKPGGPCKIGISSNAGRRLAQVQTGCPFEITIFDECRFICREAASSMEDGAHSLFTSMGKHLHGEWFDIDPRDVMANIWVAADRVQHLVASIR